MNREFCHSERSEESLFPRRTVVAIEMLRFAQHDSPIYETGRK